MKIADLILSFIACLSIFIFVNLALKLVLIKLRRRNLNSDLIANDKDEISKGFLLNVLRNGFRPFKKISKFMFQRFKPLNEHLESFVVVCNEKNIKTNKDSLMSIILFICVVSGTLSGIIFSSLAAFFTIFILVFVLFFLYTKSLIDKRDQSIRNSVPDLISSLSICFGAGYTILQSFEQIIKETKGNIKNLFTRCLNTLNSGQTIHDTLNILKSENGIPELSFVAVALDVQHQTGGSIRPVLDSAKVMVESKLDLLQKLKVQTAQAKLSARIVIILPFILLALFSIFSPNFLNAFFSSFLGIVIFCIAITLEVAGVLMLNNMLKVEL